MSRPIEWYRISPVKGVVFVAVTTFSIMMIGVFTLAFGLDSSGRVPIHLQPWMLMIGICVVITGVSLACYGFFKVLSKEGISLLLQNDGLLYSQEDESHLYSWQSIESVRFAKGKLIIEVEQQQDLIIQQSFLGINGAHLAERIIDIQRKALLGTIR